MTDENRVTVQRRISAPADEIFAIVCDPNMHVEIDGSGMLQAAPDAKQLQQVGDSFEMDMDREPLGDFPMGKYKVLNTVTRIEHGKTLEWNIGGFGMDPFGHVYGYELTVIDDGETEVILYCDWSGIPEEMRTAVTWPVVPVHMLEKSLDNLDRIMSDAGK